MKQEKPNILLIFTDDQRFDTLHVLGNEDINTPHLDGLVRAGTTFTHAHIQGGTCPAVCMPSRAMLHTGRTLFHLEGSGESIPKDHVMLGEKLQSEGYNSYGIGKWHNGSDAYARSFSGGGEIFFGGMDDHWNVPACHYDPTGRYDRHFPVVRDAWNSNEVFYRQCDHITLGKHSSELFADAAADFLKSYSAEEPFFLYLAFMAPHDPRTMPKEFLEQYDPETVPLPENFAPEHPFDLGSLRVRDELLAPFPRPRGEIKRHIAEYYAMITHLDAQIGRIMSELERSGKADNTIVVFAGDNGLAVGRHGLMGKQSLYDHSIRVPLIMSGPGVPGGERRDSLVYLLDIYPTICDLIGIETPGSVEGESLMPVLNMRDAQSRESLYFAYEQFQRAVRNDRYKLIEYNVGGQRTTQLFDLTRDPTETTNLSAGEDYRDILDGLRHELSRWRDDLDDGDSRWGRIFWKGF